MLRIWFMFDNHTFAKIDASLRGDDLARAAEKLFQKDGCGILFVRDNLGGDLRALTLHGHQIKNGWGVTKDELTRWATAVAAEESFARLVA